MTVEREILCWTMVTAIVTAFTNQHSNPCFSVCLWWRGRCGYWRSAKILGPQTNSPIKWILDVQGYVKSYYYGASIVQIVKRV